MSKILARKGSLVIIQAKNGTIWLTRRKKRRHDSRTRVPHVTKKPSVIFIPIKQLTNEQVLSNSGEAWRYIHT